MREKVCLDIEEHFPELTAHQNKEFIDITEKGCSKGLGILKLKELNAFRGSCRNWGFV